MAEESFNYFAGDTLGRLSAQPFTFNGTLFDPMRGMGASGISQMILHEPYPLVMTLTPETFLRLATRDTTPNAAAISQKIGEKEAIAPPYLEIDFSSGTPVVIGHEGRNRMQALMNLGRHAPVPVIIMPTPDMGRLTEAVFDKVNTGIVSQNGDTVPLSRDCQVLVENAPYLLGRPFSIDPRGINNPLLRDVAANPDAYALTPKAAAPSRRNWLNILFPRQ